MNEEQLVVQLRDWLGKDGRRFFVKIKREFETVNAVIPKEHPMNSTGVVHPIHFREGMRVRNKLRELTNYSWNDHEYDNKWAELVEKAISA